MSPKDRRLRVLVVAAHPDDEILGCGATMARHAHEGAAVWALIVAEGIAARAGLTPAQKRSQIAALQRRAKKANDAVGVQRLILKAFPDNRLDTVARLEIIQSIEGVVEECQPDIVYTHSHTDLNVDHQIVSESVRTACRPILGSSVKSILAFETASSTEWRFDAANAFSPNVFMDVSKHMQQKLSALSAYASEMRPFPHPRSAEYVRALATVRGGQSGLKLAEAFASVREIR